MESAARCSQARLRASAAAGRHYRRLVPGTENGPEPGENGPEPRENGPEPRENGPEPRENGLPGLATYGA